MIVMLVMASNDHEKQTCLHYGNFPLTMCTWLAEVLMCKQLCPNDWWSNKWSPALNQQLSQSWIPLTGKHAVCRASQSTPSKSSPNQQFTDTSCVSRCTFHTPFASTLKWDNQFLIHLCFRSLIKSGHCQLGVEYLRVHFLKLLVYWG